MANVIHFATRPKDTLTGRAKNWGGVKIRGNCVNNIRNVVASSCWKDSSPYFISRNKGLDTDDQEVLSR